MPTKRQVEEENLQLQATVDAQKAHQEELEARIRRMESMIMGQETDEGGYEPKVELYHDPYDTSQNPLTIKKQPDGLHLSWKNPNLRDGGGKTWEGWEPVTWDSEIGKNLEQYIDSPPKRFEGTAAQDNYIRRGSDAILCKLPLEWWLARQEKREKKTLHQQQMASNVRNRTLMPGVRTYGDGVQREASGAVDGGHKPELGPDEHHLGTQEMFTERE